ncbi:MAG TPA: hypothetical protein VL549_15105 [Gemmatimonadales bacterium]|nr:hypothetical protein [Gemmatimonadales bacterium]
MTAAGRAVCAVSPAARDPESSGETDCRKCTAHAASGVAEQA